MGKCGSDCAGCAKSCLECDGVYKAWPRGKGYVSVHTFKPYFDVTMGREVQSKREIREYCKQNGMVYAGDRELTQQCAQNKRYNEIKQDRAFEKNLTEKLMGIC